MLAVLAAPGDPLSPSSKLSLDHFSNVALKYGIECFYVEDGDYSRLKEYDALFIHSLTSLDPWHSTPLCLTGAALKDARHR
jgi:hypothetical protein